MVECEPKEELVRREEGAARQEKRKADDQGGKQLGKAKSARRTLVAGKSWDCLIDKSDDLSKIGKRKECESQCKKSAVISNGMDCKTFPRRGTSRCLELRGGRGS